MKQIVVEIGCGDNPGPLFDDYMHIGVDKFITPDRRGLMGVMADATKLPFKDSSIDTVLARNVFSDPSLGTDPKGDLTRRALASLSGLPITMKKEIITEALRVLKPGGLLIAVDLDTSPTADEFFLGMQEKLGASSLELKKVNSLTGYTPKNYSDIFDPERWKDWGGVSYWIGKKIVESQIVIRHSVER